METEDRFTPPRPGCMHPGRWHSPDADSTEAEVSALAQAFVRAIRPDLVVETGTAFGQTTDLMGQALMFGRYGGKLVSFELDAERVAYSRERCEDLGDTVQIRHESSIEGLEVLCRQIEAGGMPRIGFAWLDSLFALRLPELRIIEPWLADGAVVGIHDCGSPSMAKYPGFAMEVNDEAERLGFDIINLPTPRGVTFLGR